MNTEPNESQERTDTTRERTSPSAGWKEVYAAMGVSPGGDAESRERRDHGESMDSRKAIDRDDIENTPHVDRPPAV